MGLFGGKRFLVCFTGIFIKSLVCPSPCPPSRWEGGKTLNILCREASPPAPRVQTKWFQVAIKLAKLASAPRGVIANFADNLKICKNRLLFSSHCSPPFQIKIRSANSRFVPTKPLSADPIIHFRKAFEDSKGTFPEKSLWRVQGQSPWRFPLRSFYRSFSRRLPQKKTATVPGPVCEPIVVPISLISTLPFRCGKAASIIAATAFATSRQAEWEI